MAPGRKRKSVYINSLLKDGHRRKQIERYLIEKGYSQHFVKQMVAETIKMRWSDFLVKVLIFLAAGSIIFLLCSVYASMPYFIPNPGQ